MILDEKVKLEKALQCHCECINWLKHWHVANSNSEGSSVTCCEINCIYPATEGMPIAIGLNKERYIIPLCYEHSNLEEIEIDSFQKLAFADYNRKCGQMISLDSVLSIPK